MPTPSVLVVFFTRSGNTERIAFEIARDLGKLGIDCDVEPLEEQVRRRRGLIGYLRTGRDAILRRKAKLRPLHRNPASYDLVVVGTPIWAGSLSTPVRGFVEAHRGALKTLAVFLTYGGAGERRVLEQAARLAQREPLAELAVRERDLLRGRHHDAVKQFVARLGAGLDVLPARVATPREPTLSSPSAFAH